MSDFKVCPSCGTKREWRCICGRDVPSDPESVVRDPECPWHGCCAKAIATNEGAVPMTEQTYDVTVECPLSVLDDVRDHDLVFTVAEDDLDVFLRILRRSSMDAFSVKPSGPMPQIPEPPEPDDADEVATNEKER